MVAKIFHFSYFDVVFRWRSSSAWGRLPMEVIFIWYLCTLCFDPNSLSFKFELDPNSGCWENQILSYMIYPSKKLGGAYIRFEVEAI